MASEQDIINNAILKAAEITFKSTEIVKRLIPNAIGQEPESQRLNLTDIKRLMEK